MRNVRNSRNLCASERMRYAKRAQASAIAQLTWRRANAKAHAIGKNVGKNVMIENLKHEMD